MYVCFSSSSAVLTVPIFRKQHCWFALSANWSTLTSYCLEDWDSMLEEKKILKKPKEMLEGGRGGSQTSQACDWTEVQKQSFAAGLKIFKCACGLWSQ